MKKRKMIMTVIVTLCLIVLFMPMGFASASNSAEGSTNVVSSSLAGTFIEAGVSNISEDIAGVETNDSMDTDESPDTSDRTPIYIVTTVAAISFLTMVGVYAKEYIL